MEYFSHSPFFDRQSSNQVLKMQTMHTGVPVENEEEELKYASDISFFCLMLTADLDNYLIRRFTGVEFSLVHARPPNFFIIHKRERFGPDSGPLASATRRLLHGFSVDADTNLSPDSHPSRCLLHPQQQRLHGKRRLFFAFISTRTSFILTFLRIYHAYLLYLV